MRSLPEWVKEVRDKKYPLKEPRLQSQGVRQRHLSQRISFKEGYITLLDKILPVLESMENADSSFCQYEIRKLIDTIKSEE